MVEEAEDPLLQAKVDQAHFANAIHGKEKVYKIGDLVMLSTLHWWGEYKKRVSFGNTLSLGQICPSSWQVADRVKTCWMQSTL